jgi:hypothetical protein
MTTRRGEVFRCQRLAVAHRRAAELFFQLAATCWRSGEGRRAVRHMQRGQLHGLAAVEAVQLLNQESFSAE